MAPTVLLYEVALALVRKGFGEALLDRKIDEMMTLFRVGLIELVEPDVALLRDAVRIAGRVSPDPRSKPWLNDAIFHALARRENATLVTADRRYVARLKGVPSLRGGVLLLERVRV